MNALKLLTLLKGSAMEGDSAIEMLNPKTRAKYQKDGSENTICFCLQKKGKERK